MVGERHALLSNAALERFALSRQCIESQACALMLQLKVENVCMSWLILDRSGQGVKGLVSYT
jgi:hypothetical protein